MVEVPEALLIALRREFSSRRAVAEALAKVMQSRQSLGEFLGDALAEELKSLAPGRANENRVS